MTYDIKRTNGTTEWLVKTIRPNGTQNKKAMGENVVDMSFTLPTYVDFKINDFVVVYGETYKINVTPSVKKVAKRKYEYSIQFEHLFYDLAKVQLQFLNEKNNLLEPVFNLMGNAATIVGLIVENVNRHSSGWTVGVVDETPYQNFSFNAENCLQALNRLSADFDTEFWIDNKTIHLQKREQSSGLQFEYGKGKGLYSLSRSNKSNNNILTRLYVRGGSRNLPADYRNYNTSLLLPGGETYIQDDAKVDPETGYGLIEATQLFEQIFPHREGTVTAVVTGNDNWDLFTDETIDFDVNDYKLDTPAKVAFNTGPLAGYEFEISNYNHTTKQFTIIQLADEALTVPNTSIRPTVGDKYALLDIKMPQSYVDAAEAKLLAAAQAYYEKNSDPALNFSYAVECDPIWFAQQGIQVTLGHTVLIQDTDIGIQGEIRIAGYQRDLQAPSKYTLEVSDAIGANEIVRQYAQQQRTLQLLESSGLLDINQMRKNLFLNRLSEQNGYLMLSGNKVKAGLADYTPQAGHAATASESVNADLWDAKQFDDYLDQSVKTGSDVTFNSITSQGFVSGAFGTGFRIKENGDAEFDNLNIRKAFTTTELVAQKVRATNGAIAVTDSMVISSVTDLGGFLFQCFFDDENGLKPCTFEVNDFVRCQVYSGNKSKYIFAHVVDFGANFFTIYLDNATTSPEDGDTFVRVGSIDNTDRQGLIYLTNSDTGAPFIDVLDGVNNESFAGKTKVRLGKLDGIVDPDLGALGGYGIYAQNGFFKGKAHITGGNAETLTGSQTKANEAKNSAIASAAADATSKANAAQAAAETYANAQAAYESELAKAYADGIVDAEEARAIAEAESKLNEAKADAATKANEAKNAAIAVAAADASSKANVAQANAIASAASDAQAKADAAQDAANILSQQLVDGLKIGGRNLILNSKVTHTEFFGGYFLNMSVPNSELRGKTLTLSVDCEISNGEFGAGNRFGAEIGINSPSGIYYLGAWDYITTQGQNTKRRVSATITFPMDIVDGSNAIGLYNQALGNIKISNPKLEFGNKATDWTPAPEDVEAAVSAAQAAANAAQNANAALANSLKSMAFEDVVELSKLGSTVIEGGKIKTTLLDADFIKVNVINATYVNTLELDASAIKTGQIDSARINASQIVSNGGGVNQSFVDNKILAASWSSGRPLNPDVEFRDGFNGISIYNNYGNGACHLVRLPKSEFDVVIPTSSSNALYFYNNGNEGATTPGLGGFYFGTNSRPKAVFLVRMVLAFETGRYIEFQSNTYGNGGNFEWLTDIWGAGVNVFKEYICIIKCGADGTFNSTNYFNFNGAATVSCCIASAGVYDISDSPIDYLKDAQDRADAAQIAAQNYADASAQAKANIAQANAISIASGDAQAKANAAQSAAATLSQQLVDGLKLGVRNLLSSSNTRLEGNSYPNGTYGIYGGTTEGKEYTLVVKGYTTPGNWIGVYFNGYQHIGTISGTGVTSIYVFHITRNNSGVGTGVDFYHFPNGSIGNSIVEWAALYEGNITPPLDWTPTPEDIDAAVSNAQATANAAQAANTALTNSLKSMAYKEVVELAELGSTVIQGGKIKTSLLDADYIDGLVVNAVHIATEDLIATNVAATNGFIGGFNIVDQSLIAGSDSADTSSWALNSSYIALRPEYQLYRKIGNTHGQTDEASINLGYSGLGSSHKETLVVKNNILNTAQVYMDASSLYGSWYGLRQKNKALILEAKNSDENIALEVMSGHIYLRGVNDAGTINKLRNGYIKYVDMNGRQVLVLDDNAPEINITLYGNTAQTAYVEHGPCSSNEVGTNHSYTTAANTYKRMTQTEANTEAYNYALSQAQAAANTYGYCLMPEYRIFLTSNYDAITFEITDVSGNPVSLQTNVSVSLYVNTNWGSQNYSATIYAYNGSSGYLVFVGNQIYDFWVNSYSPYMDNGIPIYLY